MGKITKTDGKKRKHTTLAECEDALRASGGFVTHAAAMLGISWPALSERVKKHARLQRVLEEAREQHLDLAETQLISSVAQGEAWAVCFFLKCKGKGRGYIERQQIDTNITNKEPLIIKRAGKCQK